MEKHDFAELRDRVLVLDTNLKHLTIVMDRLSMNLERLAVMEERHANTQNQLERIQAEHDETKKELAMVKEGLPLLRLASSGVFKTASIVLTMLLTAWLAKLGFDLGVGK